jgi:hypothetical protein
MSSRTNELISQNDIPGIELIYGVGFNVKRNSKIVSKRKTDAIGTMSPKINRALSRILKTKKGMQHSVTKKYRTRKKSKKVLFEK